MTLLSLGAVALAALSACSGDAESERRSVLVVTVDTLRRDAVGFHGGPATPTLDALSDEAIVFDDAYTVAPITLPAHASLLSGLYPASHGVRDNGPMRVPSAVTTLAERVRARGWRTLASVAAVVLDPAFGLDQGFERYVAPPRSFGGVQVNVGQVRAEEAVDRLLSEWDELDDGEPFFAWLHLYDPHAPYDAPGSIDQTEDKLRAYQAEVAYTDRELGRLFAALRERGAWDDLIVVVASDHGEGLADGREPTHGYFVHDTTMRIPLIVRDPRTPARRVTRPVSLVDVAPTLLRLLSVPASPGDFDGVDLLAEAPGPRTLLFESYLPWISHGWAPFEGGLDAELKIVRSKRREAYARAEDPTEARDLIGAADDPRGPAIETMFAAVDARMADLPGRFEGERVEGAGTSEMLQALGYAGAEGAFGAGERPDFDALPDAYAQYPLIERMDKLNEALSRGEMGQAVTELRALVALDPENVVFLERLGETLLYAAAGGAVGAEAVQEAEDAFERALTLRPGRVRVHLGLANCAIRRNDEPRIERELRTALALEPDHPLALFNLSFLLSQRGRALPPGEPAREAFAEALVLVERLLDRMPDADPRRAEVEQTRVYLRRQAGG